ncbi:MAG TPA: heparin lyase I family protein [Opitutaceae bacterium]|nr:heparin lyase I family protein [Opitutaceae bacterium]
MHVISQITAALRRSFFIVASAAALASVFLAPRLRATTAVSLNSFEGIEEPLVRYTPKTGAFAPDDLVNITEKDGVFRMLLRYRSDVWDGDRDTHNTDRQRAEVKGLGVHQKNGDTFDYTTTWRTDPEFRGASRFCHIFQLKSTDGDSGAPLVTISIEDGRDRASVRLWSGKSKQARIVREFSWSPAAWQTVCVRIRTSLNDDGEVLASVNGDAFEGLRGVAVYRPDATDYRPKWGLYRGVKSGLPLRDNYIEHKNISAEKTNASSSTSLSAGRQANADAAQITLENAAEKRALQSPREALAWLQSQPRSTARGEAFAAIATEWARDDPASAMAFAEKLASEDGRAETLLRVFNRWTDRDPAAALQWAAKHSPSAEIDPLLWYFATDTTLRYVDRDKSLVGAGLIFDSELRAKAIGHVVLIWARREPDEAARYVATCDRLEASQKESLTQQIHASRAKAGQPAATPTPQ